MRKSWSTAGGQNKDFGAGARSRSFPEIKFRMRRKSTGNSTEITQLLYTHFYLLLPPSAVSVVARGTQPALETQTILLPFYHWIFSRRETSQRVYKKRVRILYTLTDGVAAVQLLVRLSVWQDLRSLKSDGKQSFVL